MSKYNTNDPEAATIRKKIEKLHSINPAIEIYDVISKEDVELFELENDVKLPEDYVWFITNVGNGGTWIVGNGDTWRDDVWRFYPLCRGFCWEEKPRFKKGKEKYSLEVLSTGCTYGMSIILAGAHYGEMAYDFDGMAAYHPIIVHGFKEFYLKWLDEACLGYDEDDFEFRLYGTIEEHLEQYRKNPDTGLLWSIYSKVNRQCASKQFVSDVHSIFVSETNNENKVLLARILIKTGYEDLFSVLSAIFIPENYERIVWELHDTMQYFTEWLNAEGVMEDAPKYYSMLVTIMKYYETAKERKYFKDCFAMSVMNPLFKAEDILGFLTSDDEEIVKYLAVSVYQKNIQNRVGTYIDKAKIKYAEMQKN